MRLLAILAVLPFLAAPALAQTGGTMDHSRMGGMDHSRMQGMDHSNMPGMNQSQPSRPATGNARQPQGNAQGGSQAGNQRTPPTPQR